MSSTLYLHSLVKTRRARFVRYPFVECRITNTVFGITPLARLPRNCIFSAKIQGTGRFQTIIDGIHIISERFQWRMIALESCTTHRAC